MDFFVRRSPSQDIIYVNAQDGDATIFQHVLPSESDNIQGWMARLLYMQYEAPEELEILLDAMPQLLKIKVSEDAYPTYYNLLYAVLEFQEHVLRNASTNRELSSSQLSIRIPLPPLMAVDDFLSGTIETIRAVDFLYSVFALVSSGSPSAIAAFSTFLKEQTDIATVQRPALLEYLASAGIEPLKLLSVHYGSPASFDFLGVGKVLEILRDTIKDLVWRGEHEKKMAALDQRSKQAEIRKTGLESEKLAMDIAAQKLEIEKVSIELASQSLALLEKAANLQLPEEDKRLIVTVLIPRMITIASNPRATPILMLGGDPKPK
jgi:hypothetical protein